MRKCKVLNCDKKYFALGFCPMHYARFKGYNKVPLNAPNQFPTWGQGWQIDKDGYKQINVDGKYKREHRVIMEKHLKRKLLPTEIVHHKNNNRTDNRIENLSIMSFSEHTKHHARNNLELNKLKRKALNLYKKGKSMTEIPKILAISYSCIYFYILKSGYPIRGNRGKRPRDKKYYKT